MKRPFLKSSGGARAEVEFWASTAGPGSAPPSNAAVQGGLDGVHV